MKNFVKQFKEIHLNSVKEVGTKTAYLANIYNHLHAKHIMVPNGFAITMAAYRHFLAFNDIEDELMQLMTNVDVVNYANLKATGIKARKLMMEAVFPEYMANEITMAYDDLCDGETGRVAVKTSVVAEDLREPYFADNYNDLLNIKGFNGLLHAVKQCFATLFEDKAIKHRIENRVNEDKVAISVCVQQMVRSDKNCSGTCYSPVAKEPGTEIIVITGAWGLTINPDRRTNFKPDVFKVLKDSLHPDKVTVIHKKLGNKARMMVFEDEFTETASTKNINTPFERQTQFVLEDHEIEKLSNWAVVLETHHQTPVSFKWAKDGVNHQFFLLEARPETLLQPVSR